MDFPGTFKENVPVSSHFLIFYLCLCRLCDSQKNLLLRSRIKNFQMNIFKSFFAGILYMWQSYQTYSLSENDRYRVMVDPLVLILFVYYVVPKFRKIYD